MTRPLRCEALRLLAEIHDNDDSIEAARVCLEEALELADTPEQRVTLHLGLAYVHSYSPGLAGLRHHAELAWDECAAIDEPGVLAEALAVRSLARCLDGDGIDRAAVERSLAMEDRTLVVPTLLRPRLIAGLLASFDDQLDEGLAHLLALRQQATDSGDESDVGVLLYWQSWLETEAGSFAMAVETAQAAIRIASLTGSPVARAWGFAALTAAHAYRGETAEAQAAGAEATALCEAIGCWNPMLWVTTGLGSLALSVGDPATAWEITRPLTEATEREPFGDPVIHMYLPVALEALVALGQLDRAQRLLDWYEDRARTVERHLSIALALRVRGLLMAARGDLPAADEALSASRDGFERLPMPFETARTLLAHGRVQRRLRQKRATRETLERALASFEGLGASLWAEQTRDELARLPQAPARGALTATEQRVVALVAAGLSNKEIARDLFVAVSTIELHLSHAYAKLGVHSRTQLAAALVSQG